MLFSNKWANLAVVAVIALVVVLMVQSKTKVDTATGKLVAFKGDDKAKAAA